MTLPPVAPLLAGLIAAGTLLSAEPAALLAVNAGDTPAVTGLGLREGLTQIGRLLHDSMIEEQWAYVPSAGLWFEIGRNARATDEGSEVETDALTAIVAAHGDAVVVHFHPAAYFRGPEAADTTRALPSGADIDAAIRINAHLQDSHPGARVRHLVVSPHGILAYAPTAALLEHLSRNQGNPLDHRLHETVTRYALLAANAAPLAGESMPDALARTAGRIADADLTLVYLGRGDADRAAFLTD